MKRCLKPGKTRTRTYPCCWRLRRSTPRFNSPCGALEVLLFTTLPQHSATDRLLARSGIHDRRGNTVRTISPDREDRCRRHGRGVSRAGSAAGARGGAEAGFCQLSLVGCGQRVALAPCHAALQPLIPRTFPARGAFGGQPEPPERLLHSRHRGTRWAAIPGDGVAPRRHAEEVSGRLRGTRLARRRGDLL